MTMIARVLSLKVLDKMPDVLLLALVAVGFIYFC